MKPSESTSIVGATVRKYHICNTCASLSCSIYVNFGCIVVKLVVYRPQFGNNFNIIPLYIGLSKGDRFARVSAGNKLPPNTFRSFDFKSTPRSGKLSNPFVHLIAPSRCGLLHAYNFPLYQPPSHTTHITFPCIDRHPTPNVFSHYAAHDKGQRFELRTRR